MERQPLLTSRITKRSLTWLPVPLLCTLALWFLSSPLTSLHSRERAHLCVQQSPLSPPADHRLDAIRDRVYAASYKDQAIGQLSKAVQFHTESYDEEPPVSKGSRDRFKGFADFLRAEFPLVHSQINVTRVNEYGLLYIWDGQRPFHKDDEASQPLLLMAHQDVVPVPTETLDQWTYPPWSGYYDGEFLWGRGSSDCKTLLMSTLQALELLLEANYKPQRTIIAAFGFDEESAGTAGAGELASALHHRYGSNGIWAILDEGAGTETEFSLTYAKIGTGEKGHVNVNLSLSTVGGHSSIPPEHTAIGMLSSMITRLEANPFEPKLHADSPYYQNLQCLGEHAPRFPREWRTLVQSIPNQLNLAKLADVLAKGHESDIEARRRKHMMQTSQAVDIVQGGIKSNALPEVASALVNYRIDFHSSVSDVEEHITKVLQPEAERFQLVLRAFGKRDDATSRDQGSLSVTSIGPLEVAPLSPLDSKPYAILSGTIRSVFPGQIVSPGASTGNTDTASYWRNGRNLTQNIFRWAPAQGMNIHTVNERVNASSHMDAVYFTTQFIRNVD